MLFTLKTYYSQSRFVSKVRKMFAIHLKQCKSSVKRMLTENQLWLLKSDSGFTYNTQKIVTGIWFAISYYAKISSWIWYWWRRHGLPKETLHMDSILWRGHTFDVMVTMAVIHKRLWNIVMHLPSWPLYALKKGQQLSEHIQIPPVLTILLCWKNICGSKKKARKLAQPLLYNPLGSYHILFALSKGTR